jgi:hypothetical protein
MHDVCMVAGHDERAQNANWQKVLVVDKASHYAKPDVSIDGHRCPIDTSGLTPVIHKLRLAGPSFTPPSFLPALDVVLV